MFFQVDDQFQVNPKARRLAERLLDGDLTGLAALGLWTMCGSLVQAQLTDGVVTIEDVARLTLNPTEALRLASLLVEVGLWHAAGHDCDRCAQPGPPGSRSWIYHDWWELRYTEGAKVKVQRAKRRELQDKKIIAEVWARDCVAPDRPRQGHCRYCGRDLYKHDGKGKRKWELDHVDPTIVVGARNIVLCCPDCNKTKGERTPADAGLTLRPQPAHSMQDERVDGRKGNVDSSAGVPVAPVPAGTVDPGPSAAVPAPRPSEPALWVDHGDDSVDSSAAGLGAPQEPAGTVDPGPRTAVPTAPARAQGGAQIDHRESNVDSSAGVPVAPEPAGTVDPGSHVEVSATPPQAESERSLSDSRSLPDHYSEVSRAHAGARAGLAGQGRGGSGSGGAGTGRRRRKRRRKHPSAGSERVSSSEGLDAGAPPEVRVGGGFGSPWHGYAGGERTEELACERHGLPAPCWRCERES